jgi:hypothetical protein
MNLIEKTRAVLGLGKPAVEPAPFVECPSCKHLVPASEPRDVVAAPCPSCGAWSELLAGTSSVFACIGCERTDTTTFFAIDAKGKPFSVYGLRKVKPLQPLPVGADRDDWPPKQLAELEAQHEKFTPAAIETALREQREVLTREEEEARLRIPRYCLNDKCVRYCRPTTGGMMECSKCNSKIVQLATVYKICSNPACEVSERDPATGFIPIVNGVCRTCGYPHGKKPGTVRPEEVVS